MPNHFLIAAPPYSARSGGIMVLHELCSAINALGIEAGIIFITEGSQDTQNFKFGYGPDSHFYDPNGIHHDFFTGRTPEQIAKYLRDAVIIYPDIVRGNPLGARRYATYVLGFPKFEIDSEFIVSYSRTYISNPDCILFKPFVSPYMNSVGTNHWSQRSMSLTYIGKGAEYAECSLVPGTLLVERDWPRDKQQLALLLRHCKYFFSWDSLTATTIDAVLCGAVPVLMQDRQLARGTLDQFEIGPLPTIHYSAGMDLRSTPSNVAEIDASMTQMLARVREFSSSWPAQVEAFVRQLA